MYLFCSIEKSLSFLGASGYHSLMIEVNKRCYMNEETLEKTPNFTNLHNQLQRLYEILLGWNMGLAQREAQIAARETSKNLGLRALTSTDFLYSSSSA